MESKPQIDTKPLNWQATSTEIERILTTKTLYLTQFITKSMFSIYYNSQTWEHFYNTVISGL